jgi:hypothetical protein
MNSSAAPDRFHRGLTHASHQMLGRDILPGKPILANLGETLALTDTGVKHVTRKEL